MGQEVVTIEEAIAEREDIMTTEVATGETIEEETTGDPQMREEATMIKREEDLVIDADQDPPEDITIDPKVEVGTLEISIDTERTEVHLEEADLEIEDEPTRTRKPH